MANCCNKRKVVYNWNKSVRCFPDKVFYPKNTLFIGSIITEAKKEKKKITIVGKNRHTFNDISMAEDDQYVVDMRHFNKMAIDKENSTVKVGTGTQLSKLNSFLEKNGYSLDNMGGIDKQSIGGLIATSTHGSSLKYGALSDLIERIDIILFSNPYNVQSFDKNHRDFPALMVNLGVFGIVINIVFKISNLFGIHLISEKIERSDITLETITKLLRENDYAQIYCFYNNDRYIQRIGKRISPDGLNINWLKFKDSTKDFFNLLGQNIGTFFSKILPCMRGPFSCIAQNVLIEDSKNLSSRVLVMNDCVGGYDTKYFLDFEYSCPIENCLELFSEIENYLSNFTQYSIVGTIRFVPASKALLSPYGGRDTASIDIIFLNKTIPYEISKGLDDLMLSKSARPHWGKWNELTYEKIVENNLYPIEDLEEFLETKKRLDPENIFGSKFSKRLFSDKLKE